MTRPHWALVATLAVACGGEATRLSGDEECRQYQSYAACNVQPQCVWARHGLPESRATCTAYPMQDTCDSTAPCDDPTETCRRYSMLHCVAKDTNPTPPKGYAICEELPPSAYLCRE